MEIQQIAEAILKPSSEWDNNDVIKFLQIMSLDAVIPKFKSLNIQGKDFQTLDRQFVTNQLQVSSLAYTKKLIGWLEYEREEYDRFLEQYLIEGGSKKDDVTIEREYEERKSDKKENIGVSNQSIKNKDVFKEKEKQFIKQKNQDKDPQKSKYNSNCMKFIESNLFLASQRPQTKLVMNPQLVIIVNKEEHHVSDNSTIGRQPNNQIFISDETVSRLHVNITRNSLGDYYMKDLSKYGTYHKMNLRQVLVNRLVELLIGATDIILKIEKVSQSTFDIRVELPQQKINSFFQNRSNLIIGRKSKDVKIEDPAVSNQHLSIFVVDGELVIESLEGVCYKRLVQEQNVKIKDEDVFRVGKVLLHCKIIQRKQDFIFGRT